MVEVCLECLVVLVMRLVCGALLFVQRSQSNTEFALHCWVSPDPELCAPLAFVRIFWGVAFDSVPWMHLDTGVPSLLLRRIHLRVEHRAHTNGREGA
jgi:hypothetical protein